MNTIKCIFCKETLEVEDDLRISKLIECDRCKNVMEVVWLFPLELAPEITSEKFADTPDQNGI